MNLRRLCCVIALAALTLSSGCCWRQRCCCRPVLFPRMRGALYERRCGEHGCCEPSCATCCHADEFAGAPIMSSPEPAMAPLPMPRTVVPGSVMPGPMKPAN